jgi:hypothetical protein
MNSEENLSTTRKRKIEEQQNTTKETDKLKKQRLSNSNVPKNVVELSFLSETEYIFEKGSDPFVVFHFFFKIFIL